MQFDPIKFITLAAAVLLIMLSWLLLRAGDPDTLPDFVGAGQEDLVDESCNLETPCFVNLADLLRMADTFDGAYVSTTGFLVVEFEGDSLYQSASAYDSGHYQNAIWVHLQAVEKDASQLSGTNVRLTGRFYGGTNNGWFPGYGHAGLWPGEMAVVNADSASD